MTEVLRIIMDIFGIFSAIFLAVLLLGFFAVIVLGIWFKFTPYFEDND